MCLFAAAIYVVACISPPALMDDVDAVQAQIARNMLESGDWVTARLNGIAYLEKSPLVYWMMAASFAIFGVHDWAARLPIALSVVALAWLTNRMGRWAFGARAGFYAGVTIATCIGLFLFTRILIPDVILTLTIALAMWAFLRALDNEERHPRRWAYTMWAAIATGLMLKGLIAAVFPLAAAALYLLFARELKSVWRLRPIEGIAIVLLIAAPWHVLATLRNPPYFDLTPKSEPGQYHGFFWFYFLNEHVFRFLNMRHPRDYNTVPRHLFWLFHLLWLFPWSAFFPGLWKLTYNPIDRAGRMRLLALCWAGFVLVFFTFSTTQEYYSMPVYPALALLLGCVMAAPDAWTRAGARTIAVISGLAATAIAGILWQVWSLPAPGDISHALTSNQEAYTLSLGHMGDLTLESFAYLKLPLILAGIAFIVGAIGAWRSRLLVIAAMMVLFLNAARLAMVVFDPYLSSGAHAEALMQSPPGQLIVDNQYYTFSSVFFYTNRRALLLNGRVTNLEYGSYAPGAPDVFIEDSEFAQLWTKPERYYVLVEKPSLPRFEKLVGRDALIPVKESGGKYLFTNHANLH
ncbi:MAG TPA: glycosyltransferase family 39 protein [Bryobacteraceae bacterium]|nr:glycosyltransferase family 39 protein [Bryobacteraceae bacterium]